VITYLDESHIAYHLVLLACRLFLNLLSLLPIGREHIWEAIIDMLLANIQQCLTPKIETKTQYENDGKLFCKDNPFESLCQDKKNPDTRSLT